MDEVNGAAKVFSGKLRRFFTVHFRKEHVDRQLLAREGDCHQCGTCCNFSFPCPFLTKDRLCVVYGRMRPKACKAFPVDQKDIEDVRICGGTCGYRFTNPPGKTSQ